MTEEYLRKKPHNLENEKYVYNQEKGILFSNFNKKTPRTTAKFDDISTKASEPDKGANSNNNHNNKENLDLSRYSNKDINKSNNSIDDKLINLIKKENKIFETENKRHKQGSLLALLGFGLKCNSIMCLTEINVTQVNYLF